jgi:hypothetical protein
VHKHDAAFIEQLKSNILRFGCLVPVLCQDNQLIDGHAILQACKELKLPEVPTIQLKGRSEAEIAAIRLSINKLATKAEWDPAGIKADLEIIFAFEPELAAFTGFEFPEIDSFLNVDEGGLGSDPAPDAVDRSVPAISQIGDFYEFAGGHRLGCLDAKLASSFDQLMGNDRARMVWADLPYGVSVKKISRTHGEFVEGSGDKDDPELEQFFQSILQNTFECAVDGAVAYSCIDYRLAPRMVAAGQNAGGQLLCIVTWDKGAGGMGGLYRHASEFVTVFKVGSAPYVNNVKLGKHGRNRTTVWRCPGFAQFGAGRKEALEAHPTAKPVPLVIDAILDVSHRGDIVLDPTLGSGTTIVAAHRVGRRGFGLELDPHYVDVAVRRIEKVTGEPARHCPIGLTFAELAEQRGRDTTSPTTNHAAEADAHG